MDLPPTGIVFVRTAKPRRDDGSPTDPYEIAATEAGFSVVSVCVLEFAMSDTVAVDLKNTLCHPEQFSGLILTSKQAIHSIEVVLNSLPKQEAQQQLKRWRNLPVFVVGKTTAGEARRVLSCEPLGTTSGNAKRLGEFIIDYFKHQPQAPSPPPSSSSLSSSSSLPPSSSPPPSSSLSSSSSPSSSSSSSSSPSTHKSNIQSTSSTHTPRKPLLFLCGDQARTELPTMLTSGGVLFEKQVVYKTAPNVEAATKIAAALTKFKEVGCVCHWVAFFSPLGINTVMPRLLPHVIGGDGDGDGVGMRNIMIVTIGKTSADAFQDCTRLCADAVAENPDAPSLVKAIKTALSHTKTQTQTQTQPLTQT